MKIFENFSLKEKNTFGLNSTARKYVVIDSAEELSFVRNMIVLNKVLILGGGSNVVLPEFFDGTVIEIDIKQISIIEENDDFTLVKVGAGEIWHNFVSKLIDMGIFGFENLALIPGKVGAAPIQNIGAYGIEQNKYFQSVDVFDLKTGETRQMTLDECRFGYRTSYFKQNKHKLVISSVTYKFPKKWTPHTDYKDIRDRIQNLNNFEVSPKSIFNLVTEIRQSKLPDPKIIGNAGSFFKNPIISENIYNDLVSLHPDLSGFRDGENYKLSAAKLIEKAGWKGRKLNPYSGISVSPNHSLVIINTGNGKYSEIIELSTAIIEDVQSKFGVILEREVNIVG